MWTRLFVVGIAVATLAFAQGKGSKSGSGNNSPMMQQSSMSRMEQFSQILKLDKDEKKAVKTIMDDAQKEATPVKDQMDKGRLAIAQATAGGKQEEIDAAVKSYAGAETQMASIEMNAFAKIYNALDKEQQQKSPQIYQMMPGIFKGKNWNQ
jgi:Spy/CpxP family protein refolding chaperone